MGQRSVIVSKFGGSSLSDAEQFVKVKNIVLADQGRRYIVPSAPGKRSADDRKITDILYSCYRSATYDRTVFEKELGFIRERYRTIIADLGLSLDLTEEFGRIGDICQRGLGVDYAASRGEYLNGIILSAYLGFDFVDAAEVIRFRQDGTLDAEATHLALGKMAKEHTRAIIPGFYGAMPDGAIRTFPRDGSDITGSLVARGVSATLYENWTDASGIMVIDPDLVPDAPILDRIGYDELRTLASLGAKVFHEDAIAPVCAAGIPINIRNTNSPSDRGTYIVPERDRSVRENEIIGITGFRNDKENIAHVAVIGCGTVDCAVISDVAEKAGISIGTPEYLPYKKAIVFTADKKDFDKISLALYKKFIR